MNMFATLMEPMKDRPCIDRRERLRVSAATKVSKPVVKPRRAMAKVPTPWKLSAGQSSVMPLIVEGLSYEEIAVILGIKAKTVESHLGRVRAKMRVRSTLVAALEWDRWVRARQETNQ